MNNCKSGKSFDEFRQLVLRDIALQNELRKITDNEIFVERAVAEGTLRGFEFSADEVKEEMRKMRRLWIERWI